MSSRNQSILKIREVVMHDTAGANTAGRFLTDTYFCDWHAPENINSYIILYYIDLIYLVSFNYPSTCFLGGSSLSYMIIQRKNVKICHFLQFTLVYEF